MTGDAASFTVVYDKGARCGGSFIFCVCLCVCFLRRTTNDKALNFLYFGSEEQLTSESTFKTETTASLTHLRSKLQFQAEENRLLNIFW